MTFPAIQCFRRSDAIDILELIVGIREAKLGIATSDVEDEKMMLSKLLKEAGMVENRKSRSLETLLDTNFTLVPDE